jgi:hypothetical protein
MQRSAKQNRVPPLVIGLPSRKAMHQAMGETALAHPVAIDIL